MTITAHRRTLSAVAILTGATIVAAGLIGKDRPAGEIALRGLIEDPLRVIFGVASGGAANGAQPSGDSAMVLPVEGSGYRPTLVTAPYDGPTDEERALLAEARKRVAWQWQQMKASLGPDAAAAGAMPDLRLPARHLTVAEMDALRGYLRSDSLSPTSSGGDQPGVAKVK